VPLPGRHTGGDPGGGDGAVEELDGRGDIGEQWMPGVISSGVERPTTHGWAGGAAATGGGHADL
jgi:hypothetical protein